jgi:hypothetical protein
MRKLVLSSLLVVLSSLLVVLISAQEVKIKIPSTYDELKNAYVTFVKLYLEERKDRIALQNELSNSNLKINELIAQIDKLTINNTEITNKYEKELKKRFSNIRFNILTAIDYSIFKEYNFIMNPENIKSKLNLNIGGGLLLYNYINFDLYVRVPDIAVGLMIIVNVNK